MSARESCVEDKEGVGGGDGGLDGENHGGSVGAKGSGDVEVNITRGEHDLIL